MLRSIFFFKNTIDLGELIQVVGKQEVSMKIDYRRLIIAQLLIMCLKISLVSNRMT